jgi:alkaline phosphatase
MKDIKMKMMKKLFFAGLLLMNIGCMAQNKSYTTANAHSHNDYEKSVPFRKAWENNFGSIEADIYLHNGKLIVAHDSAQLARQWSLDSLYLRPLQLCIEKNKGSVYADKNRSLQLMIDIKSEAVSTLDKLVETLKAYPALINATSLTIAISGSRPDPSRFTSYPSWILFDGELRKDYQPQELQKIPNAER